jgi:competence protein ComGC
VFEARNPLLKHRRSFLIEALILFIVIEILILLVVPIVLFSGSIDDV